MYEGISSLYEDNGSLPGDNGSFTPGGRDSDTYSVDSYGSSDSSNSSDTSVFDDAASINSAGSFDSINSIGSDRATAPAPRPPLSPSRGTTLRRRMCPRELHG
ncbi:hypothetical protein SAZ11_00610 [Streptomyces sp. FXJ1.4098]|nr:hypothetical protein [Streptomyces sp. FXJ1.4098]